MRVFFGKSGLKVSFELAVAELVALLVFAVVLSGLLDGVVGEVDVGVEKIGDVIELGRCSNVSLIVPVDLQASVDGNCQHVCPNIEFPAIVEQQIANIRLHYELLMEI